VTRGGLLQDDDKDIRNRQYAENGRDDHAVAEQMSIVGSHDIGK
jgi:hypothetical protein